MILASCRTLVSYLVRDALTVLLNLLCSIITEHRLNISPINSSDATHYGLTQRVLQPVDGHLYTTLDLLRERNNRCVHSHVLYLHVQTSTSYRK